MRPIVTLDPREIRQNSVERRFGVAQLEVDLTSRNRKRRIGRLEVCEAERAIKGERL
jgi:hypothetical protein